ncbi:HNH endonuclease signature motif containing protein [Bradyrhizobium sp. Y-H1]|jgi:hypothetical protein|uniref:HNH endonuclease n=1 Tax=Bradyrhizobium sp. Y-H1 TaxID=2485167 RepID=UPI00104A897D|nr:HNH endonuclease signature motif containing protein [Bradyrhizobium sp. Y-H1]
MDYKAYLKSAAWKKKRNAAKYWHSKRCAICGKARTDIHHKTYKALGDEDAKLHLVPLCRTHHFALHDYAKANGLNIWEASLRYIAVNARRRPRKWKYMTPHEREQYLGPAL